MREETLARVPSLSGLYATALSRSARHVLRTSGGATALPEVTYEAHGLQADVEQLAAYQQLVGEPGTDELPAGYVHVLAFPLAMALMVRSDFPLPVLGMVHIANHVTQHRPVLLGEELSARASAINPTRHRRGTQLELALEIRSGRELVWQGSSTYLAPKRHLPHLPEAGPSPQLPEEPAQPTALWHLGPQVAKRYAEVSGDRNPIHVSRLGAKLFGFARPIAHGMYTAARALAEVGPRRGPAFDWRVRFAKPVMLPSTVALHISPDGQGVSFHGYRAGKDRTHFTGSVRPRWEPRRAR